MVKELLEKHLCKEPQIKDKTNDASSADKNKVTELAHLCLI